ncbi:MAG: DJ-1/PfpI family protein [Nanoarchaeota archaeon]|nr:DJ-1/PfpI family protein [Nanoarchaeota archaeon]
MKKEFLFLFLIMLINGCAQKTIEPENEFIEQHAQEEVVKIDLTGKSVLMIIAPSNFRDEELLDTGEVLNNYNAHVVVASSGVNQAKGSLGAVVNVNKDISDVNVNDYDAIIFVGGPGADVYFNDQTALQIAKDSYENGKITAAICIAPVILANAGILDGKQATVFSTGKDDIEAKGATYTGDSVTQEGKIITANGPAAAKSFGEAIAKELAK